MLPLVARVVKRARKKVPKHFYMVFPLKNIKQLERGVLPGVKGLSGGPEIIKRFLGMGRVNNLVLKMPGEKTLQLNNLTEISYNNPQKLLDGGLATLVRLTNNKDTHSLRHMLLNRGKGFFGDSLGAYTAKDPSLEPLYVKIKRQKYQKPGLRQPSKFKGFMRKLTSFDAAVRWLRDYLQFWAGAKDASSVGKLPNSIFVRAMFYSVRELISGFKSDKEWTLHRGEPLQVPKGSILYVTYFDLPSEWIKQYKVKGKNFLTEKGILGWPADAIVGKLEMNLKAMRVLKSSNLASRYRIVLLDPIKFKTVETEAWF